MIFIFLFGLFVLFSVVSYYRLSWNICLGIVIVILFVGIFVGVFGVISWLLFLFIVVLFFVISIC